MISKEALAGIGIAAVIIGVGFIFNYLGWSF
jgi:hypothetical protein